MEGQKTTTFKTGENKQSAGYTFHTGDYDVICQMKFEEEKSSSALKTIFSLTSLRLRKSNCKLELFDNTAGDQKSGLPPEEVFSFFFQLDC